MKEHHFYTTMGLRALKRAAEKVVENARKNNLKIPIWEKGKIEYLLPEISTEQKDGEGEKPMV